ncbi:SDR family oxidoreductase [Bacillus solimangrovi]|uniref:Oxidoreductase n=1 Tax=Bacillus solimangrovi TaxID=1305675 RepID=A0A1E5LF50_9BACI|nr:SDR family oxidoreductase [Bacillus solimangrovi]OEH92704.1 oxidoreductase [Bacillus solimangrovi]
MSYLENQTAIITGASSGIGRAIASKLAEQGANVVLAARRKEKLEKLAEEIEQTTSSQVLIVETDVTNKDDVENMYNQAKNKFGSIDIYINNAGVMLLSFMSKDKVNEWDQMIDVNIKGVLYGIHVALPSMLEQDRGHIVNVSSVAGHETFPSSVVYSATKYAVRAISMGLEKELSTTSVRVTNISPGAVQTELADHITDEQVIESIKEKNKDRKILDANDIANAVTYAVTQPEYVNVNEIIVRPSKK